MRCRMGNMTLFSTRVSDGRSFEHTAQVLGLRTDPYWQGLPGILERLPIQIGLLLPKT